MASVKGETISGTNAFIEDQRNEKGKATFSLVQFDAQDPYEVLQDFVNIKDAEDLNADTYRPRGMTPLLDAVGKSINDVVEKIKALPKSKRPDKIIVVIVTDGAENASREFTREGVKKLVDEKEKEGWRFVFIGAGLDAFSEATASLGLACNTSNVISTAKSAAGIGATFSAASRGMSGYRRASVARSKSMKFFSDSDYDEQEKLGADNSEAKKK
jgi:hypothetical protein